MSKKSLINTNPDLKDPEKRELLLFTAISSSTAIEEVHVIPIPSPNIHPYTTKPIKIRESVESSGSRR
jgi:hypothetical protein